MVWRLLMGTLASFLNVLIAFSKDMQDLTKSSRCQLTGWPVVYTTTAFLWPLYRSASISWHLLLWTGGFCWCEVLLFACPCWKNADSAFGLGQRCWSSPVSLPPFTSAVKRRPGNSCYKLESDVFFCGWQCDQVQNGVPGCDDKEMRDYCQQHGFDAWFETSAKDNVNIEEAARFLIARVSIVLLNIVAALCLAAVFY